MRLRKITFANKIVNCDSSREPFRLRSQMMGEFGNTMIPSNISPGSLCVQINKLVRKIEESRRSSDPDISLSTDIVEFSGTGFAEFQLVTEDFVETGLQGNGRNVL